jgi:hypothetical protein
MWRIIVGGCLVIFAAPVVAQDAASITFVEPTGDMKPGYSKERNPSEQALIETWRSGNLSLPQKRVDQERFEIVDRRVVWAKIGRAFLQFRIFSATLDTVSWAGARCPGHKGPIEIQVFYQFSTDLNAWVPQASRGDSTETLCSNQKLWTNDQIAAMVDPPPAPTPPAIAATDIVSPPVGSPERAAIMDALRTRYESLFGKPVVFKTAKLQVAAGFAYVAVHPQRPNGTPIEKQVFEHAFPKACFQDRFGMTNEYWMKKEGSNWTIAVQSDMCADDSIVDQGYLIGAPPQLAGKDAWPER